MLRQILRDRLEDVSNKQLIMKVLLIHGLGRTSLSLLALEWRLKQVGLATEQFSYAAFLESYTQIVERLQRRLREIGSRGTYGVVAHSLGGLLTRSALADADFRHPKRIVMLGTPNRPPRLAAIAWKFPPFQYFSGQSGFNLSNPHFFDRLPTLKSPYTIIAGTRGLQGAWSPFGFEANDGIVAVNETRLLESDRPLELPVTHTFMMNNPTVQETVIRDLFSTE